MGRGWQWGREKGEAPGHLGGKLSRTRPGLQGRSRGPARALLRPWVGGALHPSSRGHRRSSRFGAKIMNVEWEMQSLRCRCDSWKQRPDGC